MLIDKVVTSLPPEPPERMFWKTRPVGPITYELTATFPICALFDAKLRRHAGALSRSGPVFRGLHSGFFGVEQGFLPPPAPFRDVALRRYRNVRMPRGRDMVLI
jgi:hypothetical protein